MCSSVISDIFGGGSSMPPPPPVIQPPPPPPQITIAPPPAVQMIPKRRDQLRPDNPVRRSRAGTRRRGKSMLKIPLNTSGGGVNI